MPVLRRRLARAHHRLREPGRHRSRTSGTWSSTGSRPASIPTQATLFIQSQVPEHAELHLLLSMITPLGWLERVPTYKDQQEKLADKDLSTYGFLGYPLLQAPTSSSTARATCRWARTRCRTSRSRARSRAASTTSTAREPGFEDKAETAVKKLGGSKARLLNELRTEFQEQGDAEALGSAPALLDEQQNLSLGDRERLFGYLEGGGKHDPARAAGAADRGVASAGPRRPEDVEVLRQRDRAARRARVGDEEDAAPCRPTRRACGAPTRATGEMPGLATCTRSIRTSRTREWVREGLHHAPASAASNASSR